MDLIWLDQAENALMQTADYIASEFGERSMLRFMKEVDETGQLLAKNPFLGRIEDLLKDRSCEYRSIVVSKQSKIVYRIINNSIEVADLWDTRREPLQQADQVK